MNRCKMLAVVVFAMLLTALSVSAVSAHYDGRRGGQHTFSLRVKPGGGEYNLQLTADDTVQDGHCTYAKARVAGKTYQGNWSCGSKVYNNFSPNGTWSRAGYGCITGHHSCVWKSTIRLS